MRKTTVYLPDDLKDALARAAATSGRSEAEVVRDAVRRETEAVNSARPRGGLFESGDSSLSATVDDALAGFGER